MSGRKDSKSSTTRDSPEKKSSSSHMKGHGRKDTVEKQLGKEQNCLLTRVCILIMQLEFLVFKEMPWKFFLFLV